MGWETPLETATDGVTIRRNPRARRMTLRVSRLDGRVTLTMPPKTSERAAHAFLRDHAGWIAKAKAGTAPETVVAVGADVPVEGVLRRIEAGAGRQARIFEDRVEMPSARALMTALKHLARDRALPRVDHYADLVGREVTGVSFRDTRSRWGSCTSEGRLMLSWRLVMAPPEVFDYVIAHEVAHLVEMNHSGAFWDVVQELRPDYRAQKGWLKTDGPGLHAYRFD
ncbi:MAG: M48 family metallopeptidase [Boseongicola sp.]|nr:M48 family metallopeptidase [Boseongicola sp.]NNJ68430.1 M48 family metallopeptidase [Boseongicola sp.]